jgi:hypothetical protein
MLSIVAASPAHGSGLQQKAWSCAAHTPRFNALDRYRGDSQILAPTPNTPEELFFDLVLESTHDEGVRVRWCVWQTKLCFLRS